MNKTSEKSKTAKPLAGILLFLIPILLATWLYAPALFDGKIQIFGDSLIHSLSVLQFNHNLLHNGISPLWTNLLYGGHPYFAEGQGGFLNPLNIIIALLFQPVTGHGVYHWLSIIIGSAGIFLLCRQFRCSRVSSTFGTLAVVFSTFWIQYHDNITVTGALCWIPWTFLCFERWMEKPAGNTALWLAFSLSLLIFAGYPQALHGTVIYLTVSLIPTILTGRYIGSNADNSWKRYLSTGLLSLAVCIGLSAIQWMPLLELVSLSHRSGGTDLTSVATNPLYRYLGGFLFSMTDENKLIVRVLGSVLVCFVASMSLLLKPGHRACGHILSVIVLVMMGMEYATPAFEYLRKYSLIPGLQYFRVVHLYLGIGIIGIGLSCSVAINSIQKQFVQAGNLLKNTIIFTAGATVFFLLWMALVWRLKTPEVHVLQYAFFIGAYLALMLVVFLKKQPWFGYAILFFLVGEIVLLRIAPVPFSDARMLETPELVKHIQASRTNAPNEQHYKIMDISSSWVVGLLTLWSPKLETENRKALLRVSPSTNVLWNIPSIHGLLALPLARHQLIASVIKEEATGSDPALPGMRLIDYLGIRYISADAPTKAAGLELWTTDPVTILENRHALPHVQIFSRYEMAGSPRDALDRLKKLKETTLILESPLDQPSGPGSLPVSDNINNSKALNILSFKSSPLQHLFEVQCFSPAFLFIADANYPGWQARIDGRSTPVYSAQILGKAVFVPPGRHQISFIFNSYSFRIGCALSFLTLAVLFFTGIQRRYFGRNKILGK